MVLEQKVAVVEEDHIHQHHRHHMQDSLVEMVVGGQLVVVGQEDLLINHR
jgi:hypothetical protein